MSMREEVAAGAPYEPRQARLTWADASPARTEARARLLFQAYLLGLPLWWALGIDFAMPLILACALLFNSIAPHRSFTLSDYLLAGVILTLGISAYLNGFLVAQQEIRVVAALYNLSLWICGLILIQQLRFLFERDHGHRKALLKTLLVAFLLHVTIDWGSFLSAYAIGRFDLQMPSLLGALLGNAVHDLPPLIRQSVTLVFTRADWGLPGVPMPRIVAYAPYPTATAVSIAVLGTLALLNVLGRERVRGPAVIMIEALIVLTLAITLTRSILGGWLLGLIVANLIFGTAWRRIAAFAGLAAGLLVIAQVDLTGAVQYRGYSSESRFENYVRAIDQTMETNPILGLGIKPREEGNHIAVGSHSTFVSAFTKGGIVGLSFAVAYLVLMPGARWFGAAASPVHSVRASRAELRVLLNLQVAVWVWLSFEDIDAPATAAMLIFIGFAFIDVALRRREMPDQGYASAAPFKWTA